MKKQFREEQIGEIVRETEKVWDEVDGMLLPMAYPLGYGSRTRKNQAGSDNVGELPTDECGRLHLMIRIGVYNEKV